MIAPQLTMGAVYSPSTNEEIRSEAARNKIPPPSNKRR
jgi:hypothetical protein